VSIITKSGRQANVFRSHANRPHSLKSISRCSDGRNARCGLLENILLEFCTLEDQVLQPWGDAKVDVAAVLCDGRIRRLDRNRTVQFILAYVMRLVELNCPGVDLWQESIIEDG